MIPYAFTWWAQFHSKICSQNAVYQGHWVFKDCVVQWNNHPAIVPEDLFFKAFNYLSPVNFDGTTNEDYRPRLGRRYSTKKQHRNVDEPNLYRFGR